MVNVGADGGSENARSKPLGVMQKWIGHSQSRLGSRSALVPVNDGRGSEEAHRPLEDAEDTGSDIV